MGLTRTFRKNNCAQIMLCSFLLVLIPVYYCVTIFHILPCIYRSPSVWYLTHVLLLTFVVFNLVTNFIVLMYTDSSVINQMHILSKHTLKGILYDKNLKNHQFDKEITIIFTLNFFYRQ